MSRPKGFTMSEETKAKISKTRKERYQVMGPRSDETKKKLSDSMKGRPLTPEHRAVVGCKKGYKQTEEHKANRAKAIRQCYIDRKETNNNGD